MHRSTGQMAIFVIQYQVAGMRSPPESNMASADGHEPAHIDNASLIWSVLERQYCKQREQPRDYRIATYPGTSLALVPLTHSAWEYGVKRWM